MYIIQNKDNLQYNNTLKNIFVKYKIKTKWFILRIYVI